MRVGIHAGEPIAEGDDLHGVAVIRAARIMGNTDGGQVLVSSIVRKLMAGKEYRFIFPGTLRNEPQDFVDNVDGVGVVPDLALAARASIDPPRST